MAEREIGIFFYMKNKVNVLGAVYKIEYLSEQDEFMKSNNYIGYCDRGSRVIKVLKEDDENLTKETLRHELNHAFFNESGIELGYEFHTEQCVNYLALQLPKMIKAMRECGALDE